MDEDFEDEGSNPSREPPSREPPSREPSIGELISRRLLLGGAFAVAAIPAFTTATRADGNGPERQRPDGDGPESSGADPDRAAGLIAKFKQAAGVVAAGWASGILEMDRTIRLPAAGWRDGDRLNKDKLAATIANVLAGAFSAKPASSAWNSTNGKLKLTFKRANELYPTLGLTDTLEVNALVASDKPGASDRLILWVSSPSVTTADENSGGLTLANDASGDEEGTQKDDNGVVDALAVGECVLTGVVATNT